MRAAKRLGNDQLAVVKADVEELARLVKKGTPVEFID
jgi:hypothetical protein